MWHGVANAAGHPAPAAMAQQQLLLLVLSVVTVGLAAVVGINAVAENRRAASTDAVVADLVRLGAEAQAWTLRPAVLGGGGRDGFSGVHRLFEQYGWTTAAWPAEAGPAPDGAAGCYQPDEAVLYCPTPHSEGEALSIYALRLPDAPGDGAAVLAVATVSGASSGPITTEVYP